MDNLEHEFDQAMLAIHRRARTEAGYNAAGCLQMLKTYRGLCTAHMLLHAPHVSEDYTALWERNRLDLSVEALILQEKWHVLFSLQEREIARKRLEEYKYELNAGPLLPLATQPEPGAYCTPGEAGRSPGAEERVQGSEKTSYVDP